MPKPAKYDIIPIYKNQPMTTEYILTVFITIFTVIDPLGLVPFYIPLTRNIPHHKHNRVIAMSTLVAILVSTIFLFLGKIILGYLKIDYYSLFMVGGLILFKIGFDMIYAAHQSTVKIDDPNYIRDISIFPLAIPMLSGPGTIATIVLFAMQSNTAANYILVFGAFIFAFLVAAITMKFSKIILKVLGETGISIISRIMGIILCALAIQFIANAIKLFISTL